MSKIDLNINSVPFNNTAFLLPIKKINDAFNDEEIKLHNFFKNLSSSLSDKEVKYFSLDSTNYVSVSSELIMLFNYNGMSIMDNQCNFLTDISHEVFYERNKAHEAFEINNEFFKYKNKDSNPTFSFLHTYQKGSELQELEIKLKSKNELTFVSKALSLVSINFDNDSIICDFKSSSFNTIIFDYDFNVKEISFNKEIQKYLNIDKFIKINKLDTVFNLVENLNEQLKDEIETYKLLTDNKVKIDFSEKKFERDISYIKVLTEKRNDLQSFDNDKTSILNDIYTHYKEFATILGSANLKIEEKPLKFIKLNLENNNASMDYNFLNSLKSFDNKVKNFMSFNEDVFTLKNKKDVKNLKLKK